MLSHIVTYYFMSTEEYVYEFYWITKFNTKDFEYTLFTSTLM